MDITAHVEYEAETNEGEKHEMTGEAIYKAFAPAPHTITLQNEQTSRRFTYILQREE